MDFFANATHEYGAVQRIMNRREMLRTAAAAGLVAAVGGNVLPGQETPRPPLPMLRPGPYFQVVYCDYHKQQLLEICQLWNTIEAVEREDGRVIGLLTPLPEALPRPLP